MISAWGVLQTSSLVLIVLVFAEVLAEHEDVAENMSKEEREELKNEAKDMFYHAYNAYMDNAYPADELMPLSCAGRYRGAESSRGDIDDALGNFSLTLIDSLDTLVVLGDLAEFERAVKLVVRDVTFDSDIVVSVFETNIRVLGGLLSAHVLASKLGSAWYRGQLLPLALDLGRRLLPAFNSTTGIPHARVNLRHGLGSPGLAVARETCTACAGTMLLEMAALSRLTGISVFEDKAHRAMDELWRLRHRSSDLMGTTLNVDSGAWVRRDSGVGAGIDSYYEYCLKAYVLLGEDRYLGRFDKHYAAVMKYVSRGPMLLDVHMHRPHTNSRNFMDALLAFWPGLQVLKGDLKPAVETHEMLRQVAQRHNFIPEAFTTDFQVHWAAHPLRPEFVESTYFLHRATGDAHYLAAGKSALRALQKFARAPCGYAAVKDVRTGIQEDRMDSFVLAETFKYLYLLFAEPKDLLIDPDEYVFTTEGHLLPLSLSRGGNASRVTTLTDSLSCAESQRERSCPSAPLMPAQLRHSMRHLVSKPRRAASSTAAAKRKMAAAAFLAGDPAHVAMVTAMGISMTTLPDGRVQLMHTLANAATPLDGEQGLLFMQEMVELSKAQTQTPDAPPRAVTFRRRRDDGSFDDVSLRAGPAHFGPALSGGHSVTGRVGVAEPLRACAELVEPQQLIGRIAVVERGDCMFVDKARRAAQAGAAGVVVVDNADPDSAHGAASFAMSGDGVDDVPVPTVFLAAVEARALLEAAERDPALTITLSDAEHAPTLATDTAPSTTTLDRLKDSIMGMLSLGKPAEQREATSESSLTSPRSAESWFAVRQRLRRRLSRGSLPAAVAQLCQRLLDDLDAAHRAGDAAAAARHAALLLAQLEATETIDQSECPTQQFRADDEL